MHGLNLSNLVPEKENICGDAIKAVSKIARVCLLKEHITLHCKLNIKSYFFCIYILLFTSLIPRPSLIFVLQFGKTFSIIRERAVKNKEGL